MTTDRTDKTQTAEEKAHNRTQRPQGKVFRQFIGEDWGERPPGPKRMEVADYTPARHETLSKLFPGERLIIPAGDLKVRSNDTDYRFRAHSAFSHLSGLGGEDEPGAVLVFNPVDEGHEVTLYFHPRAPRSSEEFYADSRHGEFWVGARLSAEEMETATGIKVAHIDEMKDAISKDLGEVQIRVMPQSDQAVEALVAELREQSGLTEGAAQADARLAEATSEMRLTKDEFEIAEMQKAIDVTAAGFDEMIRALPRAKEHWRGERVLEGVFHAKAREEGNGLGYETIAAAGNNANTLHWITNDGQVRDGELILIDAGAEVDSLYTADITRTLPISGKFTETQREVYDAVLEACERCLEVAQSKVQFKDIHAAAMEVIAKHLERWGILPVSAEESLKPENQYHRRWMPHGTSHHLGLDVHDCAQAKRELYQDSYLEPGMIFTIEPGLYFRADDLKIPERFRGIGVRIEDDILVTDDGAIRMSESIPRTAADVEQWMADIWKENS
ncbi:Xaa-Pro aminopeptidase [Trueperella bonasi]|uniref:Xaa-Pro aminopeptidase n=1 Tax=Trueperella bonasi TaxID=312286 RepID=A0ABT9NEG2_9ACTO|nr:aminopeptidase P family protein [Trueperella bonasi]MDP9805779.1 Xaa-Pro aminopeptidase [Trueperella bonasi]